MKFLREYAWMVVFAALVALWTTDTVMELGLIKDPFALTQSAPIFREVRPVFEEKCLPCHADHHWNWSDYDVAYANRTKIKFRVWTLKNMPPNGDITNTEREFIKDWVDGGGKP